MYFRLVAVLLWAGLGWGVTLPVIAQKPCSLPLAGRVTDHESGEGLAGATVVLLPSQEATQTDSEGHFHFHVCAGTYRMQVRFVGYSNVETDVRMSAATVRNFQLHPDHVLLRGAVVRGQRTPAATTQAVTTLSDQALNQTRGQALGEALQRVTGVTTIQTGASVFKPMIHGLHSNRIVVMNNGVRQEGQQWGLEHGPEIDPFIASQLSVIKGAAGVRYGSDAIGGVVLVQPAPLRDSAGTGAELHLLGSSNNGQGVASGSVEGNLRRLPALSWRAQGTAKRAGTTRVPGGYNLTNTGFAELNFSGAVGWKKENYGLEAFFSQYNTRLGIYSGSHVGNSEDLRRAFESRVPLVTSQKLSYRIERPYQQVRHDLAKLTGFVKLGAAGRLSATLARQYDVRQEYDRGRALSQSIMNDRPQLNYRNATSTLDVAWEPRPWQNFTNTIGLSGTLQQNEWSGRYFVPDYTNVAAGAFGLTQWQRGRWLAEAGLRLDRRELRATPRSNPTSAATTYTERYAFWTPAVSLGGVYEAGAHLTLRADASRTQRPPAPNERYSRGVHNNVYEEGYDVTRPDDAPPLQPETAYHGGLTATLHGNPRLNGELTVYYSRIRDYIYQVPIEPVLTVRGPFPSFRFDQTDASFRGLDLTLNYTVAPGWTAGLKGATVFIFNERLDDYQVYAPADRAEVSLRYEPAMRPSRGLFEPFVQLDVLGVRRQTRIPHDVVDMPAPAGYVLPGLQAGATVRWGSQPIDVSLRVTNALNTPYRDYLNRFRYFADEMGRNVTLHLRVPLELTRRPRS